MMKLFIWLKYKLRGYIRFHVYSIMDYRLALITSLLIVLLMGSLVFIGLSLKNHYYYLEQYHLYCSYSLDILTFMGVGLSSFMFVDSFSPNKDMGRLMILPLDGHYKEDNLIYIMTRVGFISAYLFMFYILGIACVVSGLLFLHLPYVTLYLGRMFLESFLLIMIYGLLALMGYTVFHHKLWMMAPFMLYVLRYMFSDYLFLIHLSPLTEGFNKNDLIYLIMLLSITIMGEAEQEKNW